MKLRHLLARRAAPLLLVGAALLPVSAPAQVTGPPPPSSSLAQGATPRIAAVVNNDIISTRELTSRVGLAAFVSGLPDDPETRRRLTSQVLRGIIDERLELQAATRLRLTVTSAEIDRAFADVAGRNKMTPEQLAQLVGSKGVDPSTLREQLRAQIAWLKVIGREIRPKVVVTREQIEQALKVAPSGDEEVLLSEIFLPVYDTGGEEAVMGQARDLVASIRGGADFSALARQISAAPSKDTGGDLGWVRAGALAPDLRPLVARLRPGEVSDPIATQNGVSVIGVRERRTAAATTGAQNQEAVRQRLEEEQLQRMATRYLRDLRRDAFIDVRL